MWVSTCTGCLPGECMLFTLLLQPASCVIPLYRLNYTLTYEFKKCTCGFVEIRNIKHVPITAYSVDPQLIPWHGRCSRQPSFVHMLLNVSSCAPNLQRSVLCGVEDTQLRNMKSGKLGVSAVEHHSQSICKCYSSEEVLLRGKRVVKQQTRSASTWNLGMYYTSWQHCGDTPSSPYMDWTSSLIHRNEWGLKRN